MKKGKKDCNREEQKIKKNTHRGSKGRKVREVKEKGKECSGEEKEMEKRSYRGKKNRKEGRRLRWRRLNNNSKGERR